jgi:Fe-S-cluster containining protein
MSDKPLTQDDIVRDIPRMSLDDSFQFHCGADVDCFTRCCQDISIVLTPYDVLRLKRALEMDSSEFLRQHTLQPFTKEQKIPAVLLKMDAETRRCPFVTDAGCGVYADRPWACRMYPLGVAEPRTTTDTDRRFHFLIRDDMCHGHGCGSRVSVRDWIAGQGIDDYDMMGRSFTELMLHRFWDADTPLTPDKIDMYFTACYDLDRFRRFVFDTKFLSMFDVDEARVEAMRTDDEELLEFAMQWLRFCLFGEKSMRPKASVLEAAREKAAASGAAEGQGAGRTAVRTDAPSTDSGCGTSQGALS